MTTPSYQSKADILGALSTIQNNFVLTITAIVLFNHPLVPELLDPMNKDIIGIDIEVLYSQIADSLRVKAQREQMTTDLLKSGMRSLIHDSYEVMYKYCDETGQISTFKNLEWFRFYRALRNSVAHDFKFQFKNDRKHLPFHWRNKKMTTDMEGQDLTLSFMKPNEYLRLFHDVRDFVERELT